MRHDAREQLAPGPDDDVGVGVADRDARVGRVRDPQERVVEPGLDVGGLGVERRDPLAGRDRGGLQRGDLRAVGRGAAADRLADPLRGGVPLGLEAVGLAEEDAPAGVELEGDVDERRVLALVQRALPDDLRLLAEPLQPDAHAPASASARYLVGVIVPAGRLPQAGDHEGRIKARQEPPGARAVGPAEEREVDRAERAAGRERRVPGDPEEERLPGVAAVRVLLLGRDGEPAQEDPLVLAERRRLDGERVAPDAHDRALRGVRVQPGAGGGEPLGQGCRLAGRERSALLLGHASGDVHAGDLGQEGEVPEGRPVCGGSLGGDRAGELDVAEEPLGVRRQLAAVGSTGHGGGQLVELVEEARDRVRALGVELDGLVRAGPQEEEAERLRGQDLGHPVGRRAATLGGRHLAAADVEELVGEVEGRLAVEDLAGQGVRAVAAPAGGGEVLAAGLDRHPEEAPLGGPLQVPGQLGGAAERGDPAGRSTAVGPGHVVGAALVGDGLAVPVERDGRPDLAADGTDDVDGEPARPAAPPC